MKENVYDLTGQYLALYDMADDPDTDFDAWYDTITSIEELIEDKADNTIKFCKNLEVDANVYAARAEAFAKEAEAWKAKALAKQNLAKRLKDNLASCMSAIDKPKFKTTSFSVWVQPTASVVVDVEDVEKLPSGYLVPQPPKVDKKALAADLKAGATVDGAHLETKLGLRYR